MNSLSKRQKSFFKAAQAVSTLSDHRCKIGCIIVNGHRIISSGHNSNTKCHSLQAELDEAYFKVSSTGKIHAETSAILPLLKSKVDLSRATLYTFRQLHDGRLAMARPCPRCMNLIKMVGITRIRYTTDDGYASEILEY